MKLKKLGKPVIINQESLCQLTGISGWKMLTLKKAGNMVFIFTLTQNLRFKNLKMVNCTIRNAKTPMQIDYAKGLKLTNIIINGKVAEVPAGSATK